jgi:arylsulfatase A-like enzyme
MKVHVRAAVVGVAAIALACAGPLARGAGDAIGDTGTPPAGPAQRFALVLVLDGTRYDEVDLTHMPVLASLARSGTTFSQASVGDLPSITETSHATIGTGVLPSRHHILGDTWRLPGTNRMAPNLLDMTMDRAGYIDKLLQQANTPSLAGIIHGKYKNAIVASLSAHKVYAASAMGGGHADFVAFGFPDSHGHFVPAGTPGRTPDAWVLKDPALNLPAYPRKPGVEDNWAATLGIKMLQRYRPRVLMINFPEPDNAGHMAGTNPRVIQPIMQAFDKSLGRLLAAYRAAGILSRTDVIVTADHGMVPATHTVSSDALYGVIRKAGGNPLYVGHGDYSTIYLKNPGTIGTVASALAAARIPHVVAVYKKTPSSTYQLVSSPSTLHAASVQPAYSDLLDSFDSPASPDIVLMYDENTITMTDAYRKIGRIGDHEGATWGAQHVALVASGPGIKSGYQSSFPAHLVDIAPTVETLLGARPRHQDGVPLADMMTDPPATAVSAQAATQATRVRDVQGLEMQAGTAVGTR